MIITGKNTPLYPRKKRGKQSMFAVSFDAFYLLSLLGVLFYSFFAFSFDSFSDYFLPYLILITNGVLSSIGQIVAIRRNASIHFISFIFCFLFFSIAPIIQIGANHDPIFNFDYILTIASLLSFAFIITGLFHTSRIPRLTEEPSTKEYKGGNYFIVFSTTLLIALAAFLLFKDGLFTSREGFGHFLGGIFPNQAVASIVTLLLMSTPFFGAAIGFKSAFHQRKKAWVFLFGFLMLIATIINNPIIMARYKLAGLAFFFIDFFLNGKQIRLLVLAIMLGVSVSPLLSHAFRYEDKTISHNKVKSFKDTFLSYDYDAFQLTCYTLFKTNKDGVTWGSNIAGAAFFFIPRSLWESKPPQTSHVIYNTMLKYRGVGTKNLSTPLIAEGYYALSWAGALGIGFFYWWLISWVLVRSRKSVDSAAFLVRCVFTGLVLIFLRGSLIVGMHAIIGSLIAAFIPWALFYLGKKKPLQSHNTKILNKDHIKNK